MTTQPAMPEGALVSNHHPSCCSKCGFRVVSSTSPRRRSLIRVVDELGSDEVCDLCVLPLLADLGARGELTLFVARPGVAAS